MPALTSSGKCIDHACPEPIRLYLTAD
jgi:hypothetical protein